jgi:hypothetical protein
MFFETSASEGKKINEAFSKVAISLISNISRYNHQTSYLILRSGLTHYGNLGEADWPMYAPSVEAINKMAKLHSGKSHSKCVVQ